MDGEPGQLHDDAEPEKAEAVDGSTARTLLLGGARRREVPAHGRHRLPGEQGSTGELEPEAIVSRTFTASSLGLDPDARRAARDMVVGRC